MKNSIANRKSFSLIIGLIIIFSYFSTALWAWYPSSGISLNQSGGDQNTYVVSDNAGGAIIIWFNDNSVGGGIYAQRVTSTGSTLWTSNGVSLSAQGGYFIQVISDGLGGAIVTWQDERNGPYYVFAQRINSAGSTLWSPNGIQVSRSSTSLAQNQPALASDGAGGAIFAWGDSNNTLSGVYAQRISSAGSALWDNDVYICQSGPANVITDGTGGAFIEGSVKLQRVNSNGSTLWVYGGIASGSNSAGIPVINSHDFPMVSDGAGGVIISGLSRFGYTTAVFDQYNVYYAQRINSDGSTLWSPDGVTFTTNTTSTINNVQTLLDGNGGVIIEWESGLRYGNGIFAQRINSNGSTLWTENGLGICTAEGDIHFTQLVSDGASGVIMGWQDNRVFSTQYNIYAQRVDSSGITLWADNGVNVSSLSPELDSGFESDHYPQLVADNTGGAIISWVDSHIIYVNNAYEDLSDDIYAQQVNSSGDSPAVLLKTQAKSASDTSQWVYENAPNTSSQPNVSYASNYSGATGIIKLNFSSPNQGVKMTVGKSYWKNLTGGEWYKVRMRVMSDVPNIYTSVMIYDNVPGNPFDVSAHALLSVPTTWTWVEASLFCESSSSVYSQILVRNGNSLGNLYINEVDIDQSVPQINLISNALINDPNCAWDTTADISAWAVEPAPNCALADYTVTDNALQVSFSGATQQGLKFTEKVGTGLTATSQVTVGNSVGMIMQISGSGTLSNQIALLAVYGTDSANSQTIKELNATATVGKLPASGLLETAFVVLQPYVYEQFQVRNTGSANFTLNNTYLEADLSP